MGGTCGFGLSRLTVSEIPERSVDAGFRGIKSQNAILIPLRGLYCGLMSRKERERKNGDYDHNDVHDQKNETSFIGYGF
jgi:hypothetical protein